MNRLHPAGWLLALSGLSGCANLGGTWDLARWEIAGESGTTAAEDAGWLAFHGDEVADPDQLTVLLRYAWEPAGGFAPLSQPLMIEHELYTDVLDEDGVIRISTPGTVAGDERWVDFAIVEESRGGDALVLEAADWPLGARSTWELERR